MSAGDYIVGLPFLLLTYGSVALATEIVVQRRLFDLRGPTRAVAWAVVATGGLIAACLLPALLGVLSRETALVAALALLAAAYRFLPATGPGPELEAVASPPSTRPERFLAVAGVTAAGLWFAYTLIRYRTYEPVGFDAAAAYLPTAARWLQEGSIWGIADWAPNAFYGSGPANGSVIVLSTMLPWDNDFLAHLAMFPYVALIAVTLYALGRELGAPAAVAALLATMVPAAPVVVQHGLVQGLLDPVMYFGLAAGVLFLIRHSRSGARSDLVLAGLALGICFGTKYYGYTTVAALLLVWAVARIACGVRWATVARQAVGAGTLVLATGGVWMVRNWVETGNPLMPVPIEPFGITIFDAPPDPQRPIFGFTLLDYADQPGIWFDTLAHQFRIAAGWPAIVLAAVTCAAAFLLVRRRSTIEGPGKRRPDRTAATLFAATVVLLLVYAATPYTAAGVEGEPAAAALNVRYGIPAAIAATGLAAWFAGRLGPGARLLLAAAALVATVDALRIGPVHSPGVAWVCLALGVATAAAVAIAARRPLPRPRLPVVPSRALAGGAVALLLVGGIAGYVLQRAFNDDRYVGADPALDYVIHNSAEDRTVGLAGFWTPSAGVAPVYPSFGPRLTNRVEFVGRHVDDALLRRIDSRGRFLDELRRQDPDLLVVGREGPSPIDPDHDRSAPPLAELRWARDAGWREVARSDRFVVLARRAAAVS